MPQRFTHPLSAFVNRTLVLVVFAIAPTATQAQPVVIADTEAAKANADFLVQGEYRGENAAMQVIARGNGEFDLVIYEGGLPGAGWNRTPPRLIDGDADVVADLVDSMKLTRVERQSPTLGAKPPAGAIVLFDGTPESVEKHWSGGRLSPDGLLMQGTTSKSTFQDYRLHLEFRTPFMPSASGQGRGNSGVYHQGRYETQVLDSFGLKGVNNEAGGIYTVSDPSVNACFPPLSWQTYDVEFKAARYQGDKQVSPAKMTVYLNGIAVQNDVAVPNPTPGASVNAGPEPGPIYLQDHGNPVRFQNIWILPIDAEREARRPIVSGFERFYASSAEPTVEGGELLLSSLACSACHTEAGKAVLPPQRGPDLSQVVGRIRPAALVDMIASPHAWKPGTTMPDPWPQADEPTRKANAEAIASYLLTKGAGELSERTVPREVARDGGELFHSIGCVACHASQQDKSASLATSVPLGKLGVKYTLTSLAAFLLEPHRVRPGARMPALVNDRSEAVKLAAFLLRDTVVRPASGKFARKIYRGQWDSLPNFNELTPTESDEVVGLKVNDIQPNQNYGVIFQAELPIVSEGEYEFRITSDDGSRLTIGDKSLVNDGIHPATTKQERFKLSAKTHAIEIAYFQGGGEVVLKLEMFDLDLGWLDIASVVQDTSRDQPHPSLKRTFEPKSELVSVGRNLFATSGCVNCHAFDTDQDLKPVAKQPLVKLDPNRGCLAEQVQSPAVDYQLNRIQRASMQKALAARTSSESLSPETTNVHLTMASLNCYACHARDGRGGVEAERDASFQTTTPEMGIEGRLPPPLDGVGDKLRDSYVATLLEKGAKDRPYMRTRMPGFGYEPLKAWHETVNRLDRRDEGFKLDTYDTEPNILGAGRTCVGNRGLACIKCHRFGDEAGGGIGAIDMLKMPTRLRKEWFDRYLVDPQAYRPGTRMPSSFVEGKSAIPTIYGGDPAKQIDAMWRYLSLGAEAKVPDGLIPGAIVLFPTVRPVIYRNFIAGASPRGIAVGYPGGINLVWDAEHMTLVKLWKNDFIDAARHWNDRGQGAQPPLGDAVIDLAQAPVVGYLDAVTTAWPGQSARERGAKFRGYTLNSEGQPIFSYELDGLKITDHPLVESEDGKTTIRRRVTITTASTAPASKGLVWSAARGQIEELGANTFKVNGAYTVTVSGAAVTKVRVGDQDELRAQLPAAPHIELWQQITW